MRIQPFSKTYEKRCVLDFQGIDLQKGKIYGIIGANGSGKSTFAKIVAGVLPADQKGKFTEASVGYMPQKNYAFRLSTRNNILLGKHDEAKAEALMQELQLQKLADKRADRLSGGETARMALARLMVQTFDLVILDEPTAAMDLESTRIAEELLLRYVRETGCAVLMVTHSLQQARRVADELLFFYKGSVWETGTTEEVLDHAQKEETRQFLEW